MATGRAPGGGGQSIRVDEIPSSAHRDSIALLARAFRDNPLNIAVIGGDSEQRERVNLHGMRMTFRSASAHGLLLRGCAPNAGPGEAHGALIALPPGRFPLPPPPLLDQLRCTLGQGWRVMRRWGEVHDVLAAVHPVVPHWYLFVVGVDPDRQGRGIGGALLDAMLERVDASSLPAFLETDREENLPFYARVGFRVVELREVFGAPIWALWRDQISGSAPSRESG